MRCERARKLISDDLDGRLAAKRAQALERHVRSCAACRAYRSDVALIQARSMAQPAPALNPEDWTRFERNLESGLNKVSQAGYRAALSAGLPMKWVWAGAAAALILGAAVFYLAKTGSDGLNPAFLSYEGTLGQIDREVRDNPELAESFNRLVMASIGDTIRAGHSDLPLDLLANPDFLEGWAGDSWKYPRNESGPDAP